MASSNFTTVFKVGSYEVESQPKVDQKLNLLDIVQKSAVQIEKKSQPEVDFRPTFWRLETKT
jgi:hypothetical protein